MDSTTDTGAAQQIATSAQPARRPYSVVPSRCRATAAPIEASQLTAIAACRRRGRARTRPDQHRVEREERQLVALACAVGPYV
jgi:hypothetical protein